MRNVGALNIDGNLTVDGNTYISTVASSIPLTVAADASQTANLTEWLNTYGTAGTYVSKDGWFGLTYPVSGGYNIEFRHTFNGADSQLYINLAQHNKGLYIQGGIGNSPTALYLYTDFPYFSFTQAIDITCGSTSPLVVKGSSGFNTLEVGIYGTVEINKAQANGVLQVYGSTDTYLLYTDGTNNKVGIGTNAPSEKFHVKGVIQSGIAGTTLGGLKLSGNTSGTITIQPAAAAGTYTLTLPTSDGNANEFLQTDGAGNLTWAAVGGGITIGTTTITSGTIGRILFEGSGNVVQESANLFWDNTNGRLGIGLTPGYPLHVKSSDDGFAVEAASAGYNAFIYLLNNSNNWRIGSGGTSSGQAGSLNIRNATYAYNPIVIQNGADGSGVGIGYNTTYHSAANATLFVGGATVSIGKSNNVGTALLHLGAGTASANTAPLKLTTGTSLTSPEAGAIEYTTPQLFFTNGTTIRQEIPLIQQTMVTTQFNKSNDTTLANVTNLTADLASGKTYRFTAKLFIDSGPGGANIGIAGTATATTFVAQGVVVTTGSIYTGRATSIGSSVVTAASGSGFYAVIEGTITTDAAGTITVQFAQNSSNGVDSSVLWG